MGIKYIYIYIYIYIYVYVYICVSEKSILECLENCWKLVEEHHIYKIERFSKIGYFRKSEFEEHPR